MKNTLRSAVTPKFARVASSPHFKIRCFATAASPPIKEYHYPVTDVAILGGGITGLTSAFYLTQAFPYAKITIYEASDRFGGWVRSSKLDVGGKDVYFEHGPRTLRPNNPAALITLDLIDRLKLSNEILTTSKFSPAALNRYIYYPDRLVRLPSGNLADFIRFLREPGYEDIFPELIKLQLFGPMSNISFSQDESIASLLNRSLSPKVAGRIASAGFHGIYAGDIDQLSALSVLPGLKFFDHQYGSWLRGIVSSFWHNRRWTDAHSQEIRQQLKDNSSNWEDVSKKVEEASVFTMKGGLETLVRALVTYLKNSRNVKLCPRQAVTTIHNETKEKLTIEVTPQDGPGAALKTQYISHIISTISGSNLMAACSPPHLTLSQLDQTQAVTVMVVNLYYTNPKLNPYSGFGYLIPRDIPFDQNPERALGVIFDSDAVTGLDTAVGTKLTVMLGGHWWDGWRGTYPDELEGEKMARAVLARHLKIHHTPDAVRVSLQRNCIPQYTVGHRERMLQAHRDLLVMCHGRIRVAGSWFTGIGFNDCTSAAFAVVQGLKDGRFQSGLERTLPGAEKWVQIPLFDRKKA